MKLAKMNNEELKDLAAAYSAALIYDYCPEPEVAAMIPKEFETEFTADNFRRGAEKNQGRRPDEIALSLLATISKL